MRVLVYLLLVLSPTLFAALTSHHGEAAGAPKLVAPKTLPDACPHAPELEAAPEARHSTRLSAKKTSSPTHHARATSKDPSRTQAAHSTR